MEFFRIHNDIPFMRHALTFNVLSLITFLAVPVALMVFMRLSYRLCHGPRARLPPPRLPQRTGGVDSR